MYNSNTYLIIIKMKLEEIKKLKEELKEKNFSNSYGGASKFFNYFSYIANLFSIVFAYFFIYEIASSAIIDMTDSIHNVIVFTSILILTCLELIKRFVFDKFSISFIRNKYSFQDAESKILGLISILLVVTSFYLSNNGAHKLADSSDKIKDGSEQEITAYKDTLTKKYDSKIIYLEDLNKTLITDKQKYESSLNEIYADATLSKAEIAKGEKRYKGFISKKEAEIVSNEQKIKTINDEKKAEIVTFEAKKNDKANKKIESNSSTPFMFLIFSTIIEFLILFGIWFINFYKVKSVDDFDKQASKDPKYKSYIQWTEFVNMLYKQDTRIGDVLPFRVEMMKIFKSNNMDISVKEYDDLVKMFVHISILKPKGNKKAIAVNKEDAIEKIKTHLGIE